MRSQSDRETLNTLNLNKFNNLIRTPHLILYYPSRTSLISVLIRFMGIFSALLILVVLFCVVIFQGTSFVLCVLWIFEICCFLNLSVMLIHILNAVCHLFEKELISDIFKTGFSFFKKMKSSYLIRFL
jgi:hypothetical protein